MAVKNIAKIVIVSVVSLSASSQAQAYTLHQWGDGTWSWMCNDGITVGVLDDGSLPPESVVIAACADHGGIVTADGGFGADLLPNVAPLTKPAQPLATTVHISR